MPPDGVTCKTTPEADNCRFIGGGSEMTMTCTVTPQGETDSGEKVFSGPNGTLAIVNVNGKILQDVLTSWILYWVYVQMLSRLLHSSISFDLVSSTSISCSDSPQYPIPHLTPSLSFLSWPSCHTITLLLFPLLPTLSGSALTHALPSTHPHAHTLTPLTVTPTAHPYSPHPSVPQWSSITLKKFQPRLPQLLVSLFFHS